MSVCECVCVCVMRGRGEGTCGGGGVRGEGGFYLLKSPQLMKKTETNLWGPYSLLNFL